MNNCTSEDNGIFHEFSGQCVCNRNWKFADCSLQSNQLQDGFNTTFNSTGPKWYSFYFSTRSYNSYSRLAINSTVPANVYISKGPDSDPTDLDHDLSILQVKSVNLTTQDVLRFVADGGYSVAIYLSSYDEVSNELLDA